MSSCLSRSQTQTFSSISKDDNRYTLKYLPKVFATSRMGQKVKWSKQSTTGFNLELDFWTSSSISVKSWFNIFSK